MYKILLYIYILSTSCCLFPISKVAIFIGFLDNQSESRIGCHALFLQILDRYVTY